MRIGHDHRRRAVIHTKAAEREGGYVLVMFALLLIPLLLFVGFSVDVGSWYNRASDMQKAADAASLAGVVWLPDEGKARAVALETAKKNGFDDADADIDVIVAKSTKVPNRLQVSIRDRRVGSFIYSNIGGSDLDMSRGAFAEYITPVPMGSPRNYFGTGQLVSGAGRENLFQSVNTYCSSKANGDRHQAANDSGQGNADVRGSCGTRGNNDFRNQGYELYIDAVANRPDTIELRLLDPQMTTLARTVPGQVTGETCTTTWAYTWPTNINSGWTIQTSNGRVTGPKQYQTRPNNTSTAWTPNPPNFVAEGQQSGSLTGNRYRTRLPLTSTPTTTCVPVYGPDVSHPALDRYFRTTSGTPRPPETYTVTLARPDDTPLNDVDNPVICTMTVAPDRPFESYTYLGSARWVNMKDDLTGADCPITTSMWTGRYILRIRNPGEAAATTANRADGENNWGLVARYASATGDGVCDGRTDPTCPRVYGKDSISVRAVSNATTADFFLAEIEPTHAGKRLRIELWDPGEGGLSIEILEPDGTNAWTPVNFAWSEPTEGSGTTNQLAVTDGDGDRFNAKLLSITVDLTGYNPDPAWNNNWWKIRYRFTGSVTDRTTWSAKILGDPVHLIEE